MLTIPFRFVNVEFPLEVYNFLIQCPQNEICIVPGILRVRFPTPVQLRKKKIKVEIKLNLFKCVIISGYLDNH